MFKLFDVNLSQCFIQNIFEWIWLTYVKVSYKKRDWIQNIGNYQEFSCRYWCWIDSSTWWILNSWFHVLLQQHWGSLSRFFWIFFFSLFYLCIDIIEICGVCGWPHCSMHLTFLWSLLLVSLLCDEKNFPFILIFYNKSFSIIIIFNSSSILFLTLNCVKMQEKRSC